MIQDSTMREGINFLKCDMLLKIYLQVLNSNIINAHAFDLKYKTLMKLILKNRCVKKIKLSKVSDK